MSDNDISHVDIYHKLGALEAKLDAVMSNVVNYKNDLNIAFDRLRKLEDKTIWIIGAAAGLSLVMPFIVNIMVKSFHIQVRPNLENTAYIDNR